MSEARAVKVDPLCNIKSRTEEALRFAFAPLTVTVQDGRYRLAVVVGPLPEAYIYFSDPEEYNRSLAKLVRETREALEREGWMWNCGEWVDPALADFLRTEPNPVFLP